MYHAANTTRNSVVFSADILAQLADLLRCYGELCFLLNTICTRSLVRNAIEKVVTYLYRYNLHMLS
jgi:hypothetical protein